MQTFDPPGFLTNPHLQTILAHFLRPKKQLDRYPLILDTPDEDKILLESFEEPSKNVTGQSIVLMLHGLEGCSRSSYILETARLLKGRNRVPVAMNFRSCGGILNQRKRTYHAGETGDLGFVLEWLVNRFEPDEIGLIGFSLGGNVLLKFLGERGDDIRDSITCSAVVSVPFDLKRGAESLSKGLSRIYDLHFLSLLKQTLRQKNRIQDHDYDIEAICSSENLYEFDDLLTAPIHGFSSAEDYYRKSSCIPFLDRIRVPTLLVHSRDDPMIPKDSIPRDKLSENDCLNPIITDHGGHVGFVDHQRNLTFRFWAEQTITRYLDKQLDQDTGR